MSSWNNLSMRQRADIMKLAIDKGIYDLDTIRNAYNEYAMGGPKKPVTTGGAGYIPPIQEPIKRKTVYKAVDGKVYQTVEEAKNHNKEIQTRRHLPETGRKRYSQYGYLGGTEQETRQKYFDMDKEFTDSVKSSARRYNLNPDLVASRIAREGPVDEAIKVYNGENKTYKFPKGTLYSENKPETEGHAWGLDDLGSRLHKGTTVITTSAPYEWGDFEFTNEHGRVTNSVGSPQWWFGIEGTAADLKARRDKMKKNNPWMSESQLDAAASMSYNYGEAGAQRRIDDNPSVIDKFAPFIKIGK